MLWSSTVLLSRLMVGKMLAMIFTVLIEKKTTQLASNTRAVRLKRQWHEEIAVEDRSQRGKEEKGKKKKKSLYPLRPILS
jgi:hypothetical protein